MKRKPLWLRAWQRIQNPWLIFKSWWWRKMNPDDPT